ncbi:MAG: 2-oxo acid dehydrogenase subunit E2 [Candidatus Moduliflexus flocculans]|nr:2-oxo acid dehydrogenase subunit E2 [Candidatus Moduliflexus flocculans]
MAGRQHRHRHRHPGRADRPGAAPGQPQIDPPDRRRTPGPDPARLRSRLTLTDVQHGTFTISNLGMFGINQFRAVINPPESAILAVGAVVRKPVVVSEQDEIAVRPMVNITISADHRVIDGVVAARFLADLVQGIEAPESLLYYQ